MTFCFMFAGFKGVSAKWVKPYQEKVQRLCRCVTVRGLRSVVKAAAFLAGSVVITQMTSLEKSANALGTESRRWYAMLALTSSMGAKSRPAFQAYLILLAYILPKWRQVWFLQVVPSQPRILRCMRRMLRSQARFQETRPVPSNMIRFQSFQARPLEFHHYFSVQLKSLSVPRLTTKLQRWQRKVAALSASFCILGWLHWLETFLWIPEQIDCFKSQASLVDVLLELGGRGLTTRVQ